MYACLKTCLYALKTFGSTPKKFTLDFEMILCHQHDVAYSEMC